MTTFQNAHTPTLIGGVPLRRIVLLALVFLLGYGIASVQIMPAPNAGEIVPTQHEDWHGNVMRSSRAG